MDGCGDPSSVWLGPSARLNSSREILSRARSITFDDWTAAATSGRVFRADAELPALLAEWRSLRTIDSERADRLKRVVDTLSRWDRVSSIESTAMTLYTLWVLACLRMSDYGSEIPPVFHLGLEPRDTMPWKRIRALEAVVARMSRDWNTAFVPWGEVNRSQRPLEGRYSDERPSVPLAGGHGILGLTQNAEPFPESDQRRWYSRFGSSYASVIEFGAQVRARSIMPFGQSADPASPHHMDQAQLFGRGEFKPAWTTLEEVRANAVRVYRPGER